MIELSNRNGIDKNPWLNFTVSLKISDIGNQETTLEFSLVKIPDMTDT